MFTPKIGNRVMCIGTYPSYLTGLVEGKSYKIVNYDHQISLIKVEGIDRWFATNRFVALPSKIKRKRFFPGARVSFYHCVMGADKCRGEVLEIVTVYAVKVRPDNGIGDIVVHTKHLTRLVKKVKQ